MKFEAGETVDVESLKARGLVRGTLPVKVLADGLLTKKLTVKVAKLSGNAQAAIEAVGGTVESL